MAGDAKRGREARLGPRRVAGGESENPIKANGTPDWGFRVNQVNAARRVKKPETSPALKKKTLSQEVLTHSR